MKQQARRMALCGMVTALGVVIMLLGGVLGLGMYLSPILAGLCLIPLGEQWGSRYQLLSWIGISLLSLMLVSDAEQNLMFLGFFGWYPVLRSKLQALGQPLRLLSKLAVFNGIVIALEALVVLVLVPEVLEPLLALLLLILGNVTFLVYDAAIPRFARTAGRYASKLFK